MEDFFMCTCDCAEGDVRRVDDPAIADAIANALRRAMGPAGDPAAKPARKEPKEPRRRGARPAKQPASSLLAAYERYVSGKASIEDLRSLSHASARREGSTRAALPGSSPFSLEPRSERMANLLRALEEHRLEEVDRELLRSEVECVLVHEGPRLEVVLAE